MTSLYVPFTPPEAALGLLHPFRKLLLGKAEQQLL